MSVPNTPDRGGPSNVKGTPGSLMAQLEEELESPGISKTRTKAIQISLSALQQNQVVGTSFEWCMASNVLIE